MRDTHRSGDIDEAYAEALAEHRGIVREACASEGGVEVDTQGDAFFFAFPTAPGALAAAGRTWGIAGARGRPLAPAACSRGLDAQHKLDRWIARHSSPRAT